MRFSKALISFGVASALAVGANLFSVRQAEAQSTRPYVVFVNGQGNCCAWGMDDLQNRLQWLEIKPATKAVNFRDVKEGDYFRDGSLFN